MSPVANRNKNRYMTAPSSGLCGFNFSFRCCPCRCPVVLEKSISSDKAVQFYTMMIFPLQWMWADKHTLLRTYRSHVNRRRACESIRGHHIKQLMAQECEVRFNINMYNQLRNCHNKDEIIVSRPRELYDDISLLVRFYIESTNHILTSVASLHTIIWRCQIRC